MEIPATIESFVFGDTVVNVAVPLQDWVKKGYDKNSNAALPYWAQVWPAAKALCEAIAENPLLVKNKIVLEIAAGLGLPSLLAATLAHKVIATDLNEDAVKMMQRSAAQNDFDNMHCFQLDWNVANTDAEVLLLSDINYEPASFEPLHRMIERYIDNNCTILLSTPQRLVAKSFMEQLRHWCKQTYSFAIAHNDDTVFTTVWLLKK